MLARDRGRTFPESRRDHRTAGDARRSSEEQPTVIELTEEQQRLIYRMSGQHTKVLELTPDAADALAGSGRALQFHWRQSIATGIPRQVWGAGAERGRR